uniref:Fatty acyl-CoA reductase n=1 Tax=Chenopodium quinoa TaxID=63459 RepID=A0A803LD48_CHEQI
MSKHGMEEEGMIWLWESTFGARNIIGFAQMCPNLQILINVSTAYVCGEKAGLIPETLYNLGKNGGGINGFDIDTEKKLVDNTLHDLTIKGASSKQVRDTMKQLGLRRAKLYGWPNTYVFTKAMAEILIYEHKGNLPVVIVRPTMISSTYKEPFSGWVEGSGSLATVSIINGKGYVNFTNGDSNTIFDSIPVDMVVNSIVMAMVANENKPCFKIYHVDSSLKNPLPLGKLLDINYQYFTKKPMMLKLMDIASFHSFRVDQNKLGMRIKATYKIATSYNAFTLFTGIFDDKNTEKLRIAMRKNGMDEEHFNFDPKSIDWEDYLLNNHIPATVKYLF